MRYVADLITQDCNFEILSPYNSDALSLSLQQDTLIPEAMAEAQDFHWHFIDAKLVQCVEDVVWIC